MLQKAEEEEEDPVEDVEDYSPVEDDDWGSDDDSWGDDDDEWKRKKRSAESPSQRWTRETHQVWILEHLEVECF